jgi:SAM-dependent methyltransferase
MITKNLDRSKGQRQSYSPRWPPERFIVPLLAQRIPELFRQFCPPRQSKARSLDVGCGMQPFRAMILEAGYDYLGLDVVQNRLGNVDVLGALDAPLPPEMRKEEAFDFILCTEVLEHVAGWGVAFANFTALLAPGGRILLTCPHFYPLHEAPYDFWRPTPFAIEHFAAVNGLRVLHMEQAGGPWEVLGTLLAETHCYPCSRAILNRGLAKAIRMLRVLLCRGLGSSWWKARVNLKGPYFLSNLAVLEHAGDQFAGDVPIE